MKSLSEAKTEKSILMESWSKKVRKNVSVSSLFVMLPKK